VLVTNRKLQHICAFVDDRAVHWQYGQNLNAVYMALPPRGLAPRMPAGEYNALRAGTRSPRISPAAYVMWSLRGTWPAVTACLALLAVVAVSIL
jgi:hypothetical protein